MPKPVVCPMCGSVTISKDLNFFACPDCDCEIWPGQDGVKQIQEIFDEQIRSGYYGNPKGGRGSKSRGRKKAVVKPARYYNRILD